MQKKIFAALMLGLTIFTCTSCKTKNNATEVVPNDNSQQLQLLRTDMKLTQEQLLSRIKADHIKENKGYLDNDEVISIITLPGDSLIDTYLESEYISYSSVAEYACSKKGQKQAAELKNAQKQLVEKLEASGLDVDVEYNYATILNGVAVKSTYGTFKLLGEMDGRFNIESTILSDTYNLPQTTTSDKYQAVTNLVKVYETGIFDSSSVPYTGNGTSVAVLDSGFDCSHTVFAKQPDVPLFSEDYINNLVVSDEVVLNAKKFTPSLRISDVYYSSKIPYTYDYADKDTEVNPYDSEHGTHVAGIIGGYDQVITGIAINTQLVLMKVFPDLDEGGKTEDIIAALEDAVVIGVDAINMSLGSSCGFSREVDKEAVNQIYDKINKSGISLITAASNSYSSGYGGEQGNTSFVTNPDSGTVGSPSTYPAALSVASISGVKSKYLVANDSQILFFNESNAITGKPNDFFKELGVNEGETKEFEYVTIPGSGLRVNYAGVDVKGKIALVRRGDNTFEEKARYAKQAGAVGCIIYNNIDGDILMSMGKSDHIPTISISKDDGTILASKKTGKLVISYNNQAGPFISDFSSWGPTPSLGLKPEITAHGGSIKSAIPGGGYDELSGTSMATPNLCGIVVLIRQYLKEKYPEKTVKEISVLTNELLMSTATIALNEDGNPYSPRKQGAGLASLDNAVTTKAYITVDDSDRTKLELGDDPKRTGIYEMKFNVENLSDTTLEYDLSVIGMTESVSTSDSKHIAEKDQLLNGSTKIELLSEGTLNGTTLTLAANQKVKLKVTYTLSSTDKSLIENLFPYGMYVEGFVTLKAQENEVDLNIPFLAFYGDWTEAPMFDKTYYEVESEAHNGAIDDEDKLKADYYATTPYGSYFYNYIIPLGTYLYDMDENLYEAIPATEDHIAISNVLGTIDGISAIYAGMLRNAKTMRYTIVDKLTGDVVYEYIDYNKSKAYSVGGTPIPAYDSLRIKSSQLGLINNRQYEFKMSGLLDYGDGGTSTNVRNSFNFDFYMDDEAPIIKDVSYEKKYDKTLKKDRYYITMTVYDNQYVQSISPIIFTSNSSYALLTDNPIPVYSERGKEATVKFEITDYLDDIYNDAITTNCLAFSIDDYALNSNIYLCQLPGTSGNFKFTKDGTPDGIDLIILSMYEDEVIYLTKYLSTTDKTVDDDKSYLNHLVWTSSNEEVAEVQEGLVKCLKKGRATITAKETLNGKQAVLIINVKEKTQRKNANHKVTDIDDAKLSSLRFSYFDTLFAYSRAAQTSKIGATGDRVFVNSLSDLSFYPGEQIQLHYDMNPWYVEDKYELTYTSSDPNIAEVDQNGVVKGLKEGTTIITLSASGSNINASITVTINNPFIIENRTLVAYKGLGGEVVIPDDEGILYIGAYAFCLYETDRTIEVTEEDYDKNKIPASNTSITSIVVPYGVEEIQKYAFYNCSGLRTVVLPETVKTIREYAFCKNVKLESINLDKISVIGKEAFKECKKLNNVDLSKIYAVGDDAFSGCSSLEKVDLTTLRNTGKQAFKDCTALKEVVLSENTKLSYAMFVNTGLVNVDIYEKVEIPEFCFALCNNLETITINNDLVNIGKGAFSDCPKLTTVVFNAKVDALGEQLFYNSTGLVRIVLPNNKVTMGNYCFYKCTNLTEIVFQENTVVEKIEGSVFQDTNVTTFVVESGNQNYQAFGELLLDAQGTTIIFAAPYKDYGEYILDSKYVAISDGAFTGTNIKTLTLTNPNLTIGNFAFANCDSLEKVIFPLDGIKSIGKHAFNYATNLATLENLESVKDVNDYAFANTGLQSVTIGANAVYGEGTFFSSKLTEVTIGENTKFGLGAFQKCSYLVTVNMPENGGVHFGAACFSNDILLEKIDLSKIDEEIERETFYNCISLKAAELTTVKRVGDYAFAACSALIYLNMPIIEEVGEGAFGKYEKSSTSPQISEVVLPTSLKVLGDAAFFGCGRLKEITIPSSLTKVSDYAFANCNNLGRVNLPNEVIEIGKYAFINCESLEVINLNNVRLIGEGAFSTCKVLTTIELNSVEEVGEGAFANSYYLRSVGSEMPSLKIIHNYAFLATSLQSFVAPNLEEIGEGAFQQNKTLTEFGFSKNLKKIGAIAFYECTNLANYYYQDGNKKINNIVLNEYACLVNGILYTTLTNKDLELTSIPAALNIDTLEIIEGTVRVDVYAGNANKNIEMIVFPDSMKSIGNYAFYDCTNLKIVEFKSYTAPILENSYNSKLKLSENDPGYELLHKYFDLFSYELCYVNFINLVGKNDPIGLVLPSNEDIEGYDSVIYEAYFGKVSSAERSDYEAKNKNIIIFVENAKKVEKIKKVTLTDENVINKAITAYNAIKQDYTKYDYTQEEWDHLVKVVKEAKEELRKLQFENASQIVKNLQQEINNLDTTFTISRLAELHALKKKLDSITLVELSLLDLTNYDALMDSYNSYIASIEEEVLPTTNVVNNTLLVVATLATASSTLCVVYFFKKRWF